MVHDDRISAERELREADALRADDRPQRHPDHTFLVDQKSGCAPAFDGGKEAVGTVVQPHHDRARFGSNTVDSHFEVGCLRRWSGSGVGSVRAQRRCLLAQGVDERDNPVVVPHNFAGELIVIGGDQAHPLVLDVANLRPAVDIGDDPFDLAYPSVGLYDLGEYGDDAVGADLGRFGAEALAAVIPELGRIDFDDVICEERDVLDLFIIGCAGPEAAQGAAGDEGNVEIFMEQPYGSASPAPRRVGSFQPVLCSRDCRNR